MRGWTSERRLALVQQLRFDAGIAESTALVPKDFWPVAEHLRALEPEVSLIVGDRGSGKTKLVQAALDEDLRAAIGRHTPGLRLPRGTATWLSAYPNPGVVTDPPGFRHFAGAHMDDRESLQQLFFAYLVRTLREHIDGDIASKLDGLFGARAADPDAVFVQMEAAGPNPLDAMDALDARLQKEDRWIFVAYDELDTLVTEDRQALSALLRGLLGFWVAYARRWRRVRPKIFMRTDFYTHRGDVAGADLSKLAANRVELHWSDKNLYGALLKPLANLSAEWLEYCKLGKVSFEQDLVLGASPRLAKAEDAKPFFDRLIGEHMGANRGKGFTYRWILDHVRDGNKRASPRSVVQLLVQAAEREAQSPKASGVQLIHHTSLRDALDTVSVLHVQSVTDAFPWLPAVARCLTAEREVPWERRELEKPLRSLWPSRANELPASSASELVDRMIELGIVRDRTGGKLDVPDLFLNGLGLRRKGGVARGRVSRRSSKR